MSLGGGAFTAQNKVLPGTYINFVSASKATSAISERGIVAATFMADWGDSENIIKIENADFEKNSLKLFGYDYTNEKLKYFREIFKNAKILYAFRLNGKDGSKASNELATAKYEGIRGNDLKIVVEKNMDEESKFDIKTYLGSSLVDMQTVSSANELKNNDFVDWKANFELSLSSGMSMSGGLNTSVVTGERHQAFLEKLEKYNFNTLCCSSIENEIKSLYISFTKRMRDDMGVKFQTVIHKSQNADYEGIISLNNNVLSKYTSQSEDGNLENEQSAYLVYWVAGVQSACEINRSNTNKVYDGELLIDVEYTQSELEECIKNGKFVLHKVDETVRILSDINSFVSYNDIKSEDFANNQTIRVLDQIGNDIAVLFNTKYLGSVANDKAGQISLWNDIVSYNNQLQSIRAIENFVADDVEVEQGNDKKSVVVKNAITPVNAMEKLYMNVVVK